MADKKEKRYVSDNAQLMSEWDWEKNNTLGIYPHKITCGSNKKVWWRGKCGHTWHANVYNRSNGSGCPYCSNKAVLPGFNDLKTKKPEIADEWHPTKNLVSASEVTANSNQKVWWLGKCGHEWEMRIAGRTTGDQGCPYCSGKRVLKGFNDLATTNPELIAEWDVERNGDLSPDAVSRGSHLRVNWMCDRGHRWASTIKDRVNGHGCPKCTQKTSFPEQAILYYIRKYYPDAHNGNKEYGMELDIWVPTIKVAVEYDGYWYHKNRLSKDNRKDEECLTRGIKLIRVREPGLLQTASAYNLFRKDQSEQALNAVIEALLMHLNIASPSVSVSADYSEIVTQFNLQQLEDSLATKYPEIAAEWHPTKNGNIRPTDVSAASSSLKIWWLGPCGHEWQTNVESRTRAGSGCPYCSGTKVLSGFNDLATKRPDLVFFWHPTKNGQFTPQNVSANSNKKVWWKCELEHEWQAPVHRLSAGDRCPVCSGHKVLLGFNDFATKHPDISLEWHPTKNGTLTPQDVTFGSGKKVWWLCSSCGREWTMAPTERSRGHGCGVCNHKKGLEEVRRSRLNDGANSLKFLFPDIAAQWHYEKNKPLLPEEVTPYSGKKVWWVDSLGHEWQATVTNRTVAQSNCPYCSNSKVLPGFNDFETLFPELAAEWHCEKNGAKKPSDFLPGSSQLVWWRCVNGHEWESTIYSRKKHPLCPYCIDPHTNKPRSKIVEGINDLATLHPDIACEVDVEENDGLDARLIGTGYSKKVWWLGKCGHRWEDTVSHRVAGRGCPYCSGKKVLEGFNDLKTCYPTLASEWDCEKNGDLLPQAFTKGSRKEIWWICSNCGKSYHTSINNRTRGFRCPFCKKNTAK